MGSDNYITKEANENVNFNPRSRVGSDRVIARAGWEHKYFNPRSRVGSDFLIKVLKFITDISIHAPAWGATMPMPHIFCRGCDFNPRSRVGSDLGPFSAASCSVVFQSTLPRGERHEIPVVLDDKTIFQSTLPRGERRRTYAGRRAYNHDFNPRSRVGSDLYIQAEYCTTRHFNPRSRVGSDLQVALLPLTLKEFQSTLPRGERQSQVPKPSGTYSISIHAPAWGATGQAGKVDKREIFQSTLPRGERRKLPLPLPNRDRFQSTLPRGERPLNGL